MSISIVSRVMDRMDMLAKCFPSWLKIRGATEIVVVNWGMKDDVYGYVKNFNDTRVVVIDVPEVKYFDSGKTRNLGVRCSMEEWVFTIDCDCACKESIFDGFNFIPFDGFNFINNSFFLKKEEPEHDGNCLFKRYDWKRANGYFEGLPAWGRDDRDFYRKLREIGVKSYNILCGIEKYDHDHNSRVCNFPFKGEQLEGLKINDAMLKEVDSFKQVHEKIFCHIRKIKKPEIVGLF